jgi:hypothetical protein
MRKRESTIQWQNTIYIPENYFIKIMLFFSACLKYSCKSINLEGGGGHMTELGGTSLCPAYSKGEQKLPVSSTYGNVMSIAVFTSDRHWSLLRTQINQFTIF